MTLCDVIQSEYSVKIEFVMDRNRKWKTCKNLHSRQAWLVRG